MFSNSAVLSFAAGGREAEDVGGVGEAAEEQGVPDAQRPDDRVLDCVDRARVCLFVVATPSFSPVCFCLGVPSLGTGAGPDRYCRPGGSCPPVS